jgi:hypothetical protein
VTSPADATAIDPLAVTGVDEVRRRCEARLRHINLPEPFDITEFCRRVSAERGRPLHVRGIPGPATRPRPCGIWIATADDDWIFVEQDTSPLHRQHIVLHEVAHILCGHAAADLPGSDLAGRLFPDLSPAMVRSVLSRASYYSESEREAELLASLILARAQPAVASVIPVTDMPAAETLILRRAGVALGLVP